MSPTFKRFLVPLAVALILAPSVAGQDPAISDRLRTRLAAAEDSEARRAGSDPLLARNALPSFYADRHYQPVWFQGGAPSPEARRALGALRAAGEDGLVADHYHLPALEALFARADRARRAGHAVAPGVQVDFDLLLTDAVLLFASHLLQGRVDPVTIDNDWLANRRGADLAVFLRQALQSGDLLSSLDSLRPPQAGYARLRAALARYRDLARAGGWPVVPPPGTDGHAQRLRGRLVMTGDLAGASVAADGDVVAAVQRFQARHGRDATGVVDSATLAALNVPAAERVRQIELNLERWRWLPQDLGERHILVNVAAFEMQLVERDSVTLAMRVMVGRPYRRSPVFTEILTHVVLAPFWHVTRNIAVTDKLPLIRRDPQYLTRQGYRVYRGWGAEEVEVDPATVDWSQVTPANFPFRLVQSPGPLNALGRVKFMFPNRFNVYLHDTPQRDLFDRPDRDFSSGCIRLEQPLELALRLLEGESWTQSRIEETIAAGREHTVYLRRAVPVHLQYWTAWADADGTVQFRRDLYGRDARLLTALRVAPPEDE